MNAALAFPEQTAVPEQTDGFAQARNLMVDSQVRPNKVTDPRILDAMRRLPRERFVPAAQIPLAYADRAVMLGNGRALMQPMMTARLVQLAAPRLGDRALVVACGPGYGAAVMAACQASTLALEEDPALIALARAVLPAAAPEVALVEGPLAEGWAKAAPYDIILLEGAVRDIPPALVDQLVPQRGRLVAVLAGRGRNGMAVLGERTSSGLHVRPTFDCATPAIPSLLPAPGFVF